MADETSMDGVTFNNYEKASIEHKKGNVAGFYKDWALSGQYDKDVTNAKHRGPIMVADEMEKLFTNDRDQTRIVDIGAGTGNAAIELRRRGYTHIDSIEPVPEMSKYAKEKNLYEKYICEFLTEKPLDIKEGTYDVAVSVGLFAANHVPAASVQEMLRIIKTGGYIIMVGSGYQYYRLSEFHRDLVLEMYRLETEKKMRIIKRELKKDYMHADTPLSKDGVVFVIRKI